MLWSSGCEPLQFPCKKAISGAFIYITAIISSFRWIFVRRFISSPFVAAIACWLLSQCSIAQQFCVPSLQQLPTSNWNFCLILFNALSVVRGVRATFAKLSCDNAVSWSLLHHVCFVIILECLFRKWTVSLLLLSLWRKKNIEREEKPCNFHFVCTIFRLSNHSIKKRMGESGNAMNATNANQNWLFLSLSLRFAYLFSQQFFFLISFFFSPTVWKYRSYEI